MKAIWKLWQRIQLLIGHGTLRLADDSTGLQRLQADFLKGETRGALERYGQFGLTSVPPKGAEVLALFFGGDRGHGVIIAAEDRRVRPRNLAEGESALYNAVGTIVLLKADGSIEITAAAGVKVTAPSLELSGDLKVNGAVDVDGTLAAASVEDELGTMAEMRQDYNLHTHAGVQTGSGTTAIPLPLME